MKGSKVTGGKRDTFLAEIGIREFSEPEIKNLAKKFAKEVEIGWNRPRTESPTTEDGGLLAIKTGIKPITPEEWNRVPEASLAIAATYAGTHWITSVVKKVNGSAISLIPSTRTFSPEEREYKFSEIAGFMTEEINKVLEEAVRANILQKVLMLPIGISFGFPIKTSLMGYGIDASFTSKSPSKSWLITDWQEDQFFGLEIIKIMFQRFNLVIDGIYFDNDTKMIASNIVDQKSDSAMRRVGFVFGTGDNSCEGEVNLESGRGGIMEKDAVLNRMIKKRLVPEVDNIINEYWMGGDYLRSRVACSLELLEEKGYLNGGKMTGEMILESKDGAIVSKLAMKDDNIYGKHIPDNKRKEIIAEVSETVLAQAGQLVGIQIAEVCRHAGYKKGAEQIPVEGSVYHKGFGVKEKAGETIDLLIPGNKLKTTKASSILGAGQFAMVQKNKRVKLSN